jgi:hypothetical protein
MGQCSSTKQQLPQQGPVAAVSDSKKTKKVKKNTRGVPELPLVVARDKLQTPPPVFVIPKADAHRDNHLAAVYLCEYEHGTEYTALFLDEDRPNWCEDLFYDAIRRPLFGRTSDIETFFIFHDDNAAIKFPGCFSADQKWDAAAPHHEVAEIPLCKFETCSTTRQDGSCATPVVIYVNTWNHLLGNVNNNTTLATATVDNYEIRYGSRADVDAQFRGLLTSVSKVVTDETAARLGAKRPNADVLRGETTTSGGGLVPVDTGVARLDV